MNITTTLSAEVLKVRRTHLIKLCVGAAAFIPLVLFIFDNNTPEGIAEVSKDPWNIYFMKGWKELGVIILPIFIILVCTMIPQLEYRNNTWKQVLTSPQPYSNLFFSKFIMIQLFILLLLLCYNVFTAISLIGVQLFKGDVGLWQHSIDWKKQLLLNGRLYLAVLGISALQFWMGMRFRNFIASIGIGVALWIISIIVLVNFKFEHINVFPFSSPILVVFEQYASMVPKLLWSSVAYMVVLLAIAFFEFRKRRMY